MALNKQKIALPFATGIDTKTDDKQKQINSLNVLENCKLDKPGKLRKRNGYDNIELDTDTSTTITNTKALSTFKNELNIYTDNEMFNFIPSTDKWSNKGKVNTAIPETTPVTRTNTEQDEPDCIHTKDMNMFVYTDSNGIYLSIVDNISENFLLNRELISASGDKPNIVVRGDYVYLIYGDGTDLKYRKFLATDYKNIESEVTIISATREDDTPIDAILIDDYVTIAFASGTNSAAASDGWLSLVNISLTDVISTVVEITSQYKLLGVDISTDSSNRVVIAYSTLAGISSRVNIVIYNTDLSLQVLIPTTMNIGADELSGITAIETSTDSYTVIWNYFDDFISNTGFYLRKREVTVAGVLSAISILKQGVCLASKPFLHNGIFYVNTLETIKDDYSQPTYYILNFDGDIISKFLPNNGGQFIGEAALPKVPVIDSTKFLIATQAKGRLVEENGTFFSILGINSTVLDFDPESKYKTASIASNLHITGGVLKMYDGIQVVEHGFNQYPEDVLLTTATTGGVLSDGSYSYQAVYAWTDAQGVIHRSAPSIAVDIELTGGTTTQKIDILVSTLRLTEKTDAIIELYRTESNGTIYYKVTDTKTPVQNDTTTAAIYIRDYTITDSDLIDNEIIYITGGVLDNFPAPACSIIEKFQNRVYVTTPEATKLNYSKIQFEGFPIEFSDSLELVVPETGGNTTALTTMDDKLIIFKESSIYYLSGGGPNNIGEQDTFIDIELITAETGCVNQNSVVLTPLGIMFKDRRGIYILTKSLELQYIGSYVEGFNDLTITSAITVPDKNQVRFTTIDGDCLVYNYFQQKWSTFTNHKGIAATSLNSEYYYLRTDDKLYKQNNGYNDDGAVITSKIESGWISFAGIQNYQRVYKLMILGGFKSNHDIKVKIAYNFKDEYIQEETVNVSDFATSSADKYQFRINLSIQKCESIKVSIEDILTVEGESFEISNILFVVGTKISEYKTSEAQTFGTD